MQELKYNKITPELVEQFKQIVPGKVHVNGDINEDYFHDEMPIYGKGTPDVVVEATTTEDIAKIVKICYENNIPVIPRGAGTGLTGAAVAIYGGVMIDMSKMNKILGYDKENFVVKVQAGVLLNDLAEDAQRQGLLYPPDPGEKFATVGGNVSTNAGGMRAVKYGCTRDYVRAMTVVLPTGEIVKMGATVSKTSTGYSLINLMVGSEGTLGIITELTLKVIPAPKETISLIIPYENLEDCIATVPKFFMAHLQPQALEFMEKEIVLASERYLGKSVFPQELEGTEIGAYLLVTFDGNDMEELEAITEEASEVVFEQGAIDVLVADTPAKKKDAWAARGSFLEAIEAETKLLDECDVVVPVNQIATYLTFVKSLESNYDFKIKSFGHAGDGNLHIYACANDMDETEFKKQVADFMKVIYKKAAECGGLISGEHGIGHGKMEYLADFAGEANMRIMRGIKEVFDPKMILNPGKVCYKL
ncbi:putative FAD-linked oxidoreductase [Fusobacterium sp. DD29]|uniref:FAD-binding oxidoreductase n=1 Tax=unclassified Fusobacterium TaxID=2648384 RepID=UPI001B8CFAF9|nr:MULTISPECIES: FAD-binding oxidoreductase [unclassified Fusobacterium]MBR8701089.1 putative FAD-linked oxidoreductase [Fusobacterium sp. DD45]MBR8710895.1 putative FAD-linked oxidoreductase [Fusobacterium sp. DD28]MBR8748542.1 putative FAD-linked oxidoreductase [Fusobacterium sp. DD29]MBR8751491.1 putative FAD-linked oxidoreductase [Fusobacterium sp. DD26]MBR8760809.1 putative FAD-linked oxidoreductase [Fusobacterium sp. DD25]